MATWYWSADILFWQVSIDHNLDVRYQRSTRQIKAACLCQPIIWSMAAMLRVSVVVVVAVVRTRPRAIPLAMITRRKSTHGFPFLSYMSMGLCLAALRAAGAPLLFFEDKSKGNNDTTRLMPMSLSTKPKSYIQNGGQKSKNHQVYGSAIVTWE